MDREDGAFRSQRRARSGMASTRHEEARRDRSQGWGEDTAQRRFETYPRIALTDEYIVIAKIPDDVPEKKSWFGLKNKAKLQRRVWVQNTVSLCQPPIRQSA